MNITKSAGGIIVNSKKQICLVNQRGVCWAIPKGHIENGESVEETARREIKEETGIENLHLIKELGILKRRRYGSKEMKHIHVFLFKMKEENLKPDSNDESITEAKWFDIDRAIQANYFKEEKEFLEKNRDIILSC